jgi:hypothetical protein
MAKDDWRDMLEFDKAGRLIIKDRKFAKWVHDRIVAGDMSIVIDSLLGKPRPNESCKTNYGCVPPPPQSSRV